MIAGLNLEAEFICFMTPVIFCARSFTLEKSGYSHSGKWVTSLRKLLLMTRLMLLKFLRTDSLGFSPSWFRNVSYRFLEFKASSDNLAVEYEAYHCCHLLIAFECRYGGLKHRRVPCVFLSATILRTTDLTGLFVKWSQVVTDGRLH